LRSCGLHVSIILIDAILQLLSFAPKLGRCFFEVSLFFSTSIFEILQLLGKPILLMFDGGELFFEFARFVPLAFGLHVRLSTFFSLLGDLFFCVAEARVEISRRAFKLLSPAFF